MMDQVNAIFMGRQLTFCDLVTVGVFARMSQNGDSSLVGGAAYSDHVKGLY